MKKQRGGIEMLVIYAIAIAAITAIAWGAWASFTGAYVERGREEVRATYAPILAECDKRKLAPAQCVDAWLAAERDRAQAAANLSTCEAASAGQSAAVAAAEAAAKDAAARTSRILAEIAKRSEATAAEIAKLKTIAATPAASRVEACNAADDVLRALAARRMRFNPGGPATGTTGSGEGSSDAGAGAVRIRP